MSDESKAKPFFGKPLKVINVGLEWFQESVSSQGIETVQVDWQPPASGDERLARLLDKLLD
jgi:hypothetical protein